MKQLAKITLFLLAIAITLPSFAEGKIVKWVDQKGVTHYGDKPPMPSAATKSKVLNNQGVTVNTVDQSYKDTKLDEATKQQSRRDAALLASYNNIEEIDVALERNTKIDVLALENLETKLANQQAQYNKNLALQADPKKNKTVAAEKANQENRTLLSEIAFTQTQIDSKKLQIAETRKRYEADKIRFDELKPRSYALSNIKDKQARLIELQQWRAQAQARADYFQNRITQNKRSNNEVNQTDKDSYLGAVREVERADAEISATKLAIQRNQHDLSKN